MLKKMKAVLLTLPWLKKMPREKQKILGRRCLLGGVLVVVLPLTALSCNIQLHSAVKASFHIVWALAILIGVLLAFDDEKKDV